MALEELNETPRTTSKQTKNTTLLLFGACVVVMLVASAVRVHRQLPWVDEIFELMILRHFSAGHIVDALKMGLDTPPPFYFWLLKPICAALGVSAFAIRLPSVVSEIVLLASMFFLLRKRVSLPAACLGAVLTCMGGVTFYLETGRPYAIVMALYAVAALLWINFPASRHPVRSAVLLALCVAGMLSVHFLSVVEIMALAAAELLRTYLDRRIRWPLWIALAGGTLWLAASAPVIVPIYRLTHASIHAPGFYARPTIDALVAQTWGLVSVWQCVLLYGVLLLLPVVAAVPALRRLTQSRASNAAPLRDLNVLSFASLTIPVAMFLVARFGTGSLNQRYIIAAWIGVVLFIAQSIERHGVKAWVVNLLLLGMLLQDLRYLKDARYIPTQNQLALWQGEAAKPLPVVAADAGIFFVLRETSAPELRSRLVYVGRPPGAPNPDPEPELIAWNFKRAIPEMSIWSAAGFLPSHPHFYLYDTDSKREGLTPWLREHATMHVVAQSDDATLYEVQLNPGAI